MGKHRVTLISDTHTKHAQLTTTTSLRKADQPIDLPGGDILIHAGDFMSSGYNPMEAVMFFQWFDAIDNYDTKILIAGNHDRWMQDSEDEARSLLKGYYKTIEYLQDEGMALYNIDEDASIKLYGSPWQPEFHNWAFNLPRNGEEMQSRWNSIPEDTDILVTHGPAFGHLDIPGGQSVRVGCEMLRHRIDTIRPKIHVCGHIHGSYGYHFDGHTHFFNASVLDERYKYTHAPFTFEWDNITNEITWI
jgi:Icc-related predicted phosphoesterase